MPEGVIASTSTPQRIGPESRINRGPVEAQTSVEHSLSEVLGKAGLAAHVTDARFTLDFRHLDAGPVRPMHRQLLETITSLLLALPAHTRAVKAVIPSKPTAQRILADSGLMFALANLDAEYDLDTDIEPDRAIPDTAPAKHQLHAISELELPFEHSPFRRLLRHTSWAEDFSPHSTDLRTLLIDAIQRDDRDKLKLERVLGRAHLGVVGTSSLGLVNPHYLPNADAVAAVTTTASPWLRRIVRRRLRGGGADVDDVLRILTEAFENVIQHAWHGAVGTRRSLISISQVGRGRNVALRLQILDNGIGIPASIADTTGRRINELEQACASVESAFTDDGLFLPNARGFGLPRIRRLVEEHNGSLRVTTAGPGHSQIVYTADGDRRTRVTAEPRPVSGTVIAVHLPLTAAGADGARDDDNGSAADGADLTGR